MPAGFDRCVSAGGRVRTKTLGKGRFMRICFKDGKSFAGEVKTAKGGMSKHAKKSAEKRFRRDD